MRQLVEDLRQHFTYHSNAIEGNPLTLRETRIVLKAGVTIGGHPLREHLVTINQAAFDYLMTLTDESNRINLETMLYVHRLLISGIDPDAGRFRQRAVYIRGAPLTPPHPGRVPEMVATWLEKL